MSKNLLIRVILVILVGIGFFVLTKQNSPSVPVTNSEFQSSPSAITEKKPTTDTSNWTVYTNKTYGYTLKFPTTYQVTPQTENEIRQQDIDNNMGIERKLERGNRLIAVSVRTDKDNMTLVDYMNENLESYGITVPLVSYTFNGYASLLNNNQQLGTNIFIKRDRYIYNIGVAKNANFSKEIEDIVATFKFANNGKSSNYDSAVKILQAIPEIQIIENAVIKNARRAFFTQGDISGDVVKVWLYEGGFADQHTTRIDTFNVNVKTKIITVDDVAMISGKESITLEEWKKAQKGRFQ